jgi:uncharacterized membrane protein YbhN (UPF0104 family)
MKKFLNILKKTLPWLVALFIFAYLFREYKPAQLLKAVEHANILYFLGLALIYFTVLYFVDSYTMAHTLTRFGHKISTREILPARGVTYLIMNINYPASQAAFAYYLKRTRGIPIFEVLGVFFFIAIIDLYLVMTMAFIGSFFQDAVVRGVDIGEFVKIVVLIAYGLFVAQLFFWRQWFSKITGIKREFKLVTWVRSKKIFGVFNEVTLGDYARVALMRSPIHVCIVLFLFIGIKAFHAYVPLVTVVADVPIAFLIGTIPITPGGLGTTNVAIVELMYTHVSGALISKGIVTAKELILAVTLVWMVTNYTLKSLVGIAWLQKVSKQLFKPTEQVDPDKVVSEATHLMGDI